MAITSSFANLATVTRASKKTDAGGWDGTNGGAVDTLSEYAANVAAIHATAGLRIDEGSTNEIRNPRCEGAVPGTPGTLPTYWSSTSITEVVGQGVENGWPYVDVRYAATPGANTSLLTLESSFITSTPSGAGADWTFSAGIRVVGGSTANVTGLRLRIYQFSSVPAFLSAVQGDRISPDGEHRRYHSTLTTNNASTDSVKPEIMLESSSGAIDITLRIYGPQLENKAYATGLILPTAASPAAASSAADDVSLTGPSWIGSDHTLYVEHVPTATATGSLGTIFDLSDGTAGNRIAVRHGSATELIDGLVQAGGSTVANPVSAGTVAAGTTSRIALGVAEDDVALSVDGETQVTASATGTLFTPTELQLGAAYNASAFASGYIKDLRYFPRRLSNAELEAMVGN